MSFSRFLCALALVLLAGPIVPLHASDGTVTGTLTINGKKFPLTHIYGRKREAWPADAKALGADDVQELSCGIVELILTNKALSEAAIAGILQNEYQGSREVRGIRVVIDGSGKHKWETMFLLESGAVRGFGITQSSGEIRGGARFAGELASKNEDVTDVRIYEVAFDTAVRVQYLRTETESAERIPASRFTGAFLEMLPGEWNIERWLGLGCTTATGTLVVGERIGPRSFQGTFHIRTSNGDEIEEDLTISTAGPKVHLEGGRVSVPENVWRRDVIDLELWSNLMVGNTDTDFLVLRKKTKP